jgi:PTH1 family peptidyl-tRNA hydrolase
VNGGYPKVYLIAGLGNPGREYRYTRHNVGYRVIEHWSRELGVSLNSRRFQARSVQTSFDGRQILLIRPVTYMNESGRSVRACADYYHVPNEEILVVHDDLDLPLGRVKLARRGGAGGHKGVRSVIRYLGTEDFPRVKVGIGRPRYGEPVETYVLSPFYGDEKGAVERVIPVAVEACELLLSQGIEGAMNAMNCRNPLGAS